MSPEGVQAVIWPVVLHVLSDIFLIRAGARNVALRVQCGLQVATHIRNRRSGVVAVFGLRCLATRWGRGVVPSCIRLLVCPTSGGVRDSKMLSFRLYLNDELRIHGMRNSALAAPGPEGCGAPRSPADEVTLVI